LFPISLLTMFSKGYISVIARHKGTIFYIVSKAVFGVDTERFMLGTVQVGLVKIPRKWRHKITLHASANHAPCISLRQRTAVWIEIREFSILNLRKCNINSLLAEKGLFGGMGTCNRGYVVCMISYGFHDICAAWSVSLITWWKKPICQLRITDKTTVSVISERMSSWPCDSWRYHLRRSSSNSDMRHWYVSF
jgi:hypothetical protein